MPQANVETRTALMTLQEDLEQSQRNSFIGHLGVLTGAVLALNDQAAHTNERLDHIEADLTEVKADLAGVKTHLNLLTDEVRVTGARVERLVQYIIRDEKQEG